MGPVSKLYPTDMLVREPGFRSWVDFLCFAFIRNQVVMMKLHVFLSFVSLWHMVNVRPLLPESLH